MVKIKGNVKPSVKIKKMELVISRTDDPIKDPYTISYSLSVEGINNEPIKPRKADMLDRLSTHQKCLIKDFMDTFWNMARDGNA